MDFESVGEEIGKLSISPTRIAACAPLGLVITWEAEKPLQAGACLRFQLPLACPPPQLTSPLKAGYCRCEWDGDGKLTLSLIRQGDPKDHAYVTRWGHSLYAELASGTIEAGQQIRLLYGCAASEGITAWGCPEPTLAPHFSGMHPIGFALDATGKREAPYSGMLRNAQSCALEVCGQEAVRQHHFVCARGEGQMELDACDNPVAVAWKPSVCSTHDSEKYQIYFGDIHCHSVFSDGLGTPADCYRFARDWAGLDFCAVTDHGRYVSEAEWENSCLTANKANQDGHFVTLVGYELSHPHAGDKNIYYPADWGPLLREMELFTGKVHPIEEYFPIWLEHKAMMMAHLHARHLRVFYHPQLCRLMEVYSNWGCCERAGAIPVFLPALRSDFTGQYAQDALNAGWQVGLTANSDDHMARPGWSGWHRVERAYRGGLTAVYARELSRQAIFDALYRRNTYATSGARMRIECTGNGALPGESIAAPEGTLTLLIRVTGEGPLAELSVIHQGAAVWQKHLSGDMTAEASITLKADQGYWYLRVTQRDGHTGWVSPFYVKGEERV